MKKEELRIIFMGTPEFAVETLRSLVEQKYNVVAVVTQPDKPVGRHGSVLCPSDVKKYAVEHDIPVLQPVKMKDPEFIETLKSYKADLQVVVAFRMLPEVVWAMPRFGTFNVHAALLPQYRGAAPINWAVINGEKQTGVTTFFLDHDIDTGRIIMQEPFEIKDSFNVEDVYNGLMHLGADICIRTIDEILKGNGMVESMPQEKMIAVGTVLHDAPKIFKDTCRIDWNQPCKKVYDFIRGLSPYPGAWTEMIDEEGRSCVLKIYDSEKTESELSMSVGETIVGKHSFEVRTSDKMLLLREVQQQGKKRMSADDFVNGLHSRIVLK